MDERYVASMVLSGVGDAMGYYNGSWEFCHSGRSIHDEFDKMGGINKITLALPNWSVSDDTVMHLATAEALIEQAGDADKVSLYTKLAVHYKKSMEDMSGRAAGPTCISKVQALKPNVPRGHQQPYDARGGGCGAAMRAMCIGLRYPKPGQIDDLIAVSIESGRMTHHHPTGYLGSLASALFVAFSVQGRPVKCWGRDLMHVLTQAKKYVEEQGKYVDKNIEAWPYFQESWTKYLELRQITDGESEPVFPDKFGVEERDAFYKSLSFGGWGGASGHDSTMIAYDALLGSGASWEQLCRRGMLHSGDNDSTGVIAGACFGAMYGFNGVPQCNYKSLEYRDRLTRAAEALLKLASP